MAPAELDRIIALATERYRAQSARHIKAAKREARWGAVRAWIRWILHI